MIRWHQAVSDRWHFSTIRGDGSALCEHGLRATADHGRGLRWQVRWRDDNRVQRSRNFPRKIDAEQFASRIVQQSASAGACLILECRHAACTDAPVPLCRDHLDILLGGIGRKRGIHAPVVYFALNGSRVKIGWTANLKARMPHLSLPLSAVLLQLPGGPAEENMYHRKFAKARVGRTEWFEYTPELAAFIEQEQARAAKAAA